MNKNYSLYCRCGCKDGISFKWDDEDLAISFVSCAFSYKQGGIFRTIKDRIKFAWSILRGKEYCLYDVLITKDELQEFKKWVNSLEAHSSVFN